MDERAEGQKLLAAVQPGDVIITSKLDRMFRSALDALRVLEKLKRSDISLHMIDVSGEVSRVSPIWRPERLDSSCGEQI